MASGKYPRNNPCFCGSGKKYKTCHGRIGTQKPLSLAEVIKRLRKAFGGKSCLAPVPWLDNCSNKIVNAHSVPKSSSLRQIEEKGKVYSVTQNVGLIAQAMNYRPGSSIISPIEVKLNGINKASTFKGFCSVHDSAIFKPLEEANQFTGSLEECFLLGYRALALELHKKKGLFRWMDRHEEMERGKSLNQQMTMVEYRKGISANVMQGKEDFDHHKSAYDQVMLSRDFRTLRGHVIKIDGPPPVMCCTAFEPLKDVEGVKLQDLEDFSQTPDLFGVNSFHGGESGFIVFSWLEQSDLACRAFIKSLSAIPNRELTKVLIRFLFQYSENLHFAPGWWDGLGTNNHSILLEYLKHLPEVLEPKPLQANDGLLIEPWKIVSRFDV